MELVSEEIGFIGDLALDAAGADGAFSLFLSVACLASAD